MFPVLFAWGPVAITSLGVLLVLAFFFGSFDFWRRAREEHWEDQSIFDLLFLGLLGGLFGARLMYIGLHIVDYPLSIVAWLTDFQSDHFHWLGFLLGFAYVLRLVGKHHKWSFFTVADMVTFGLVFAQICVRLGQFLHGSALGTITTMPVGVLFPGQASYRHPVQLYDVVGLVAFFWLLRWIEKQYRFFGWYQDQRGEAKPGLVWLTYLGLYGLSQFGLDFVSQRHVLGLGLSGFQFTLIGLLIAVGLALWLRSGRTVWLGDFFSTLVFRQTQTKPDPEPIRRPMHLEQPSNRPKRFVRSKA